MTEVACICLDISLRRGGFELDTIFETRQRVTAIVGPSGAGKSTVLDAIAGLARPDRGQITRNGETLFDSADKINLPPERRHMGYVFQDALLFPHLSVEGNLNYGRRQGGQVDTNHLIEVLGIAHLMSRRPATLSGGERQRVAIARALFSQPSLLLLDEPMANVDPARREEMLAYLEALPLVTDAPIIYVSHNMDEVLRLAEHVVVLDQGKVVVSGALEEVFSHPATQGIFSHYDSGNILLGSYVQGEEGLGYLEAEGFRLALTGQDIKPGSRLRLRIRARDIALALERPKNTSIVNVVEGKIARIEAISGAETDIITNVGSGTQTLRARITRYSAERLNLKQNQKLFLMIKAVAITRVDTEPR